MIFSFWVLLVFLPWGVLLASGIFFWLVAIDHRRGGFLSISLLERVFHFIVELWGWNAICDMAVLGRWEDLGGGRGFNVLNFKKRDIAI